MDWKECRKFIKDEFAENKKKCRDKLRKITKELEPDFKVDGIDAFFKNVGEGLVQAQKSMDSRTVEYLATDPAIPSVFRIPKVNAELSFSLKQGTSGGFLAQLLSGGEDEKTMAHKVNFDIVSVPPPPEVVQQLGVSWLGSFVVTDLITRRRLKKDMDELFAEQERIVKKLKKNSKPAGVEEVKRKRLERFKKHFHETIILQGGGGFAFLLIFEASHKNKKIKLLDIFSLYDRKNLLSKKNKFADPPHLKKGVDGVLGISGPNKGEALISLLSGFVDKQQAKLGMIEPEEIEIQ